MEVLSFQNQQTEYPVHYHETYCISLIEKGVFGENELIVPSGKILISHPYELHNNKPINNINFSFSTFYVSQDVINFISPFEHTSFQNKVIEAPSLYNRLINLVKFIAENKEKKSFFTDFYNAFHQIIFELTSIYGDVKPYIIEVQYPQLNDLKRHIMDHLNTKINLSELAKIVGMSKFQFIRWFKVHVGMTPFEYILLKRVGNGKKLLKQGVPLVDVALDSGFYDQSHFSNYFKKYVGMSPNVYKQSCNIFQDF